MAHVATFADNAEIMRLSTKVQQLQHTIDTLKVCHNWNCSIALFYGSFSSIVHFLVWSDLRGEVPGEFALG